MIFIIDFSESVKLFFSLKFSFTFVNFALVSEKHFCILYIYFLNNNIVFYFLSLFFYYYFVYSFCFFTFLEICDISMFYSFSSLFIFSSYLYFFHTPWKIGSLILHTYLLPFFFLLDSSSTVELDSYLPHFCLYFGNPTTKLFRGCV